MYSRSWNNADYLCHASNLLGVSVNAGGNHTFLLCPRFYFIIYAIITRQVVIGISEKNLKNMQTIKNEKLSNLNPETAEQNRALQDILDRHKSNSKK